MGGIAHGGLRNNGDFGLRVGGEVALHEGKTLIQVAGACGASKTCSLMPLQSPLALRTAAEICSNATRRL